MKLPMNLSERLERAARKADEIGLELSQLSSNARKINDDGVATNARLALLMHAAAAILRAACDPSEAIREDNVT